MAVTRLAFSFSFNSRISRWACGLALALFGGSALAAVLPEDRADILIHQYQGDNSTFNGPSILVRKQYKDKVSLWANYYVDINSTASIDVVTQSSVTADDPFHEERVQTSVGADYLHGKTMISAAFTNSSENDYEADNYSFGISQDFFGDLSTISLSYSKGDDEIYQNDRRNRPEGGKDKSKSGIVGRDLQGLAQHQRFGLSWTQVMTKNWIVALKAEAVIDEGFLKNPYRSMRVADGTLVEDSYPTTRNSEAYALNSMVYLPWRAAFKFEYRNFADSWDIRANNVELKYVHPFRDQWIFDFRYRYYQQSRAYFYTDYLAFVGQYDFYGRDKEMSTFQNNTIGFGVTYELKQNWVSWVDKTTVNFYVDHVMYDFEDFLDARESQEDPSIAVGEETPFSFDAQAFRFFISFWY